MSRQVKRVREPIFVPEDLEQFCGWEVRKINVSEYNPGIILQNPDSGERRKLCFIPSMFDGENMFVMRRQRLENWEARN